MKKALQSVADALYIAVAWLGALIVGDTLTAKDIEQWKDNR